MRALMESAAIRTVMADLVAGRQSYATLKWRLLKTFELGLAWRASENPRLTAAAQGFKIRAIDYRPSTNDYRPTTND